MMTDLITSLAVAAKTVWLQAAKARTLRRYVALKLPPIDINRIPPPQEAKSRDLFPDLHSYDVKIYCDVYAASAGSLDGLSTQRFCSKLKGFACNFLGLGIVSKGSLLTFGTVLGC